MTKLFTLILLVSFSNLSFSAPIPATSSSEIIGSNIGLFLSDEGFSISSKNTDWEQALPPKDNPYIQTLYLAPSKNFGVQASLTVRVDKLAQDTTPHNYVKKWIKDYPRLGFRVLNAKRVKVNENNAFLLDLINKNNSRQIRQVLFAKKSKVILLTCRDHKNTFKETVKNCNDIIRNFDWTNWI